MRINGNKTHGDLAELGMVEFINQFLYDFESTHVGKDLFRKKMHEEDIIVSSIVEPYKNEKVPISLKAYGDGPLQLSTDKESSLFNFLRTKCNKIVDNRDAIKNEILLAFKRLKI